MSTEGFIPQGEVATEPEPIKSGVTILEESKDTVAVAGGGMTATGNISDTVQPELEKEARQVNPVPEQFESQKDLFSILKNEYGQNPQETPNVTPSPTVPPPVQSPQVDANWESEKQSFLAKITELESQLTFQKELEKNPLEVMAKWVPGIVFNKQSPYFFDKNEYVKQKVEQKYGTDFVYDASEAYKPNTLSYIYRTDVESWERDANNAEQLAQNSITEEENKQKQSFERSKSLVMQKYGMDNATFEEKIVSKLKNMTDTDRLMVLSDAIMILEGNQKKQGNLNNSVNPVRNLPPSPIDVAKGTPTIDSFDVEMAKMFGNPYGVGTGY